MAGAVLTSGTALAERFDDEDGILFEGTIWLAPTGTVTCNVLEGKYPEQEYEQLTVN